MAYLKAGTSQDRFRSTFTLEKDSCPGRRQAEVVLSAQPGLREWARLMDGSLGPTDTGGIYTMRVRLPGTQPLSLFLENVLEFSRLPCINTFIILTKVVIVIPSGFI